MAADQTSPDRAERAARAEALSDLYDISMYDPLLTEYYGASAFHNFGYWSAETATQHAACEALMDALLAFLPEKAGTILDVACGMGATTRRLLDHYPLAAITGINISDKQLATARETAPGATFLKMDATALTFEGASFDAVICVEAAFHFNTRREFIAEAFRVLKPGGRLVLSDIFIDRPPRRSPIIPEANLIPDLASYRGLYEGAGFVDIETIDVTERTKTAHLDRIDLFLADREARGEGSPYVRQRIRSWVATMRSIIRSYWLVAARKPG